MAQLTEERMKSIIKNRLIDECTEDEKRQVFNFAFGKDYMKSKDKGAKKKYKA